MSRHRRERSVLVYGAATLCIAVFLPLRVQQVRHQVEQSLLQNVSVSLPPTSSDVSAWLRSREAQAEILARVLDEDLQVPNRDASARYRKILAALDRDDGFVASWLVDPSGRVLAASGDTSAPPARAQAPGLVVSPGRALPTIDVIAQAGAARVIFRASPRATSFPNLNPARPNNHTGRTTLFYRRGDSLIAAATHTNGSPEYPRGFSLPTGIRPLDAAGNARPESGVQAGRSGRQVAYAVVPTAFPGWTLLREQEVEEVLKPVWWTFASEAALISAVVILLAALVDYSLRASSLRRDHELTGIRADFVASVSHELRTPLAQIRMYAELLRKGSMRTPEDTRKALNVIEKEAHRLNILVDNVLNFTRLRRRTSQVPSVPTRIDDDIAHVVEAFAPLARERAVCVETALEPGLTAAVDSLALRQIVLNFLENAVKYGPVGQTVRVSAHAVGRNARVAVEDHGPGVLPSERASVWEPFVRGAAAASNTTGSGIGLAVVRDLVLQHGGRCAVEDTEAGTGARFVVEFPRFTTT